MHDTNGRWTRFADLRVGNLQEPRPRWSIRRIKGIAHLRFSIHLQSYQKKLGANAGHVVGARTLRDIAAQAHGDRHVVGYRILLASAITLTMVIDHDRLRQPDGHECRRRGGRFRGIPCSHRLPGLSRIQKNASHGSLRPVITQSAGATSEPGQPQ
jgi:hypothetical protein